MYGKWIDILQRVRNEQPEQRHLESGPDASQENGPKNPQTESIENQTETQKSKVDESTQSNARLA